MAASEDNRRESQQSATKPPSHDELVRLVGALEPARLAEIERIQATVAEIEDAVAYAAGEDDVMGEARIPLTGRAAEVYEILVADQEFEEER